MPKRRVQSNNIMNPAAKECGVVDWIEGFFSSQCPNRT